MQRTISIPASAGGAPGVYVEQINPSSVFYCIASGGEVTVRPDNQGDVTISQGRKFGNPNGKQFSHLTFLNATAAAIELTFYASNEDYKDTTVPNIGEETFIYAGKNPAWTGGGLDLCVLHQGESFDLPNTVVIGASTYARVGLNLTVTGGLDLQLWTVVAGVHDRCIDLVRGERHYGEEFKNTNLRLYSFAGVGSTVYFSVAEILLSKPIA